MSARTRTSRINVLPEAPGAIAVVVGVMLLRLSLLSSVYQRYVKVSARPLLIASGFVLISLGIVGIVRARRERQADAHAHAHDHGDDGHGHRAPLAALLLLIPVLVVFLVTPPALGSYAASRAEQKVLAKELKPAQNLPKPVDGVVNLSLEDYWERTSVAENLTVGRYGLIGFVTKDPKATAGEFDLTRITIVCCAADAQTVVIPIQGIADPPKVDTWVRVVGSETVVNGVAELKAISLQKIKQPQDPYGH